MGERHMSPEELDKFLGENPTHVEALLERAAWRLLEQDWAGVIKDFEAVLETDPKTGFDGRLAGAYARAGDFPKAEREFERELSLKRDDTALLSSRAEFLRERGDFEGARKDLLKAAELKPKNSSLWAALAGAEYELGDYETALGHIARALEGSPGYWPYLHSRAELLFRLCRWSEAEIVFTMVLDMIDGNESCRRPRQQAYRHRGWARFLGKEAGALEDLEKAVTLDPLDTLALCYRGVARCSRRDKKAGDDFDAALSIDPGLAMAYAFRGDFRLHIAGDRPGALEDYRKALELEPELKDAVDRMRSKDPGGPLNGGTADRGLSRGSAASDDGGAA
jgi:tetratricopeptide (TPR) repeat protein